MLMYGDVSNIINTGAVYNITSLKEGMIRLPNLIPPNLIGKFVDKDFDIAYANYIMSNDIVFKEFFDIIYNLYIGNDVYLVVSKDDWSENLIESIIKLIQQRYGYNAVQINSFDDYIHYINSSYIPDFAPGYGIYNLDIDKDRYTYIIENDRIKRTGQIYTGEY